MDQSSNVKVYSSSYLFGVNGAQTGLERDGKIFMRTHPNYRGTILALVIISVVCGFIVFTHFIVAR